MKKLDFVKNSMEKLTLEELAMTYRDNDSYGRPVKGIYHFELIQRLLDMFESHHLEYSMGDIMAAGIHDSSANNVEVVSKVAQIMGKNALEAHILRRVYVEIELPVVWTHLKLVCLVAYHQKGIQVAFGIKSINNTVPFLMSDKDIFSTQKLSLAGRGVTVESDVDRLLDLLEAYVKGLGNRMKKMAGELKNWREKEFEWPDFANIVTRLMVLCVTKTSHNQLIGSSPYHPLSIIDIYFGVENVQVFVKLCEKFSNNKPNFLDALYLFNHEAEYFEITKIIDKRIGIYHIIEQVFKYKTTWQKI